MIGSSKYLRYLNYFSILLSLVLPFFVLKKYLDHGSDGYGEFLIIQSVFLAIRSLILGGVEDILVRLSLDGNSPYVPSNVIFFSLILSVVTTIVFIIMSKYDYILVIVLYSLCDLPFFVSIRSSQNTFLLSLDKLISDLSIILLLSLGNTDLFLLWLLSFIPVRFIVTLRYYSLLKDFKFRRCFLGPIYRNNRWHIILNSGVIKFFDRYKISFIGDTYGSTVLAVHSVIEKIWSVPTTIFTGVLQLERTQFYNLRLKFYLNRNRWIILVVNLAFFISALIVQEYIFEIYPVLHDHATLFWWFAAMPVFSSLRILYKDLALLNDRANILSVVSILSLGIFFLSLLVQKHYFDAGLRDLLISSFLAVGSSLLVLYVFDANK